MFELKLVFPGRFDGALITDELLKSENFVSWNEVMPDSRFKTLFKISPGLTVPLCHSSAVHAQINHQFTVYTLGVYSKMFERLMGCAPDDLRNLKNPDRLKELIDGFIRVTYGLKNTRDLHFATISDESMGFANPNCEGCARGLYVENELCDFLGLVPDSSPRDLITLVSAFTDEAAAP